MPKKAVSLIGFTKFPVQKFEKYTLTSLQL